MALRLLYGRAGTGKTSFCLDEMRAELRRAPEGAALVMLLPEHETFKIEKELANTEGLGGFTRSYIFGFRRFAHRILMELGGAVRPQITEIGKRLLLAKVMHAHTGEWKMLGKATRQRNFTETLAKMIEEFKAYHINSEVLKETVAGLSDSPLKDKLSDLALIYQGFSEGMTGRYNDAEDCLNLLAEKLSGSKIVEQAHIWIDGFRFFNPQELAIIEQLLQTAKDVTITLCIDDVENPQHEIETSVFHRQYKTRQKLLELAENLAVPIVELELKENHRLSQQKSLVHIEQNLYRFPLQTIESQGGVVITEAANRRLEVEGIAADIIRLCREKGYRWRDIAILVRNQESYDDVLNIVLQDYEIPFFSDSKRHSVHHPLAELLRSSLEALHGWRYEPLFRCFKTDLFGVSRDDVDLLENYVLQFGIRGNRWIMAEDWQYRKQLSLEEDRDIDEKTAAELAKINEIRRTVIAPLYQLEKRIHKAKTVTELTAALYQLLVDLEVPMQLEHWAIAAEQQGDLAEAREHQQLWESVIQFFDQLAETCGDETMELISYEALINDGLEGLKLSLIPPGLDYVTVASLDQNSTANSKAIYIVGVNEGVLPRRGRNEGLLTDVERVQMATLGLELSPGVSADNFAERFLIYAALTRATEYLWLSYALADDEGNGLVPSALIQRVREMLSIKELKSLPLEIAAGDERLVIARPRQSLSYLAAALRQYAQRKTATQQLSDTWQAVYNWAVVKQEVQPMLKTVLAGLFHQGKVEPLPPELAELLYTKNRKLRGSVTRFERFKACPFQHFAQYGLSLKERAEFRWQAPDLGQFLHAVLKEFGEKMKRDNRTWNSVNETECKQICSEIVEMLAPRLQNEILLSSNQYKHLLTRIERTVERALKRLIEFDGISAFKPMAFEKSFGAGKELEPLQYALNHGYQLEINGQIDRIDTLEYEGKQYFIIIDYKSGNAYINLLSVYYGLKLQLLTYLLVAYNASKAMLGEQSLPAGVLYYFIKNPQITGKTKMSESAMLAEVHKAMKMPGWVLADPDIVRCIDGQATFIKTKLTQNGELNKMTLNSVKSSEEFMTLLGYMDQVLVDTGNRILAGDIAVSPYELEGKRPCEYCQYSALCQFDNQLETYAYRKLEKLDNEQIMQAITEEVK